MSNRTKIIVLSLVIVMVIAALLVPQLIQSPAEEIAEPGTVPVSAAPNENPYQDYLEARRDQQPVVLEFYARW